MRLKQRPEDFSVIESYRFTKVPDGEYFVYRMDKQKVSTLQAVDRLRERFHVKRKDISYCGLKDKQGRTEQIIAIKGKPVELQEDDMRLTFLGRTDAALSSANITSNRFSVIVRDLKDYEVARIPESIEEVKRTGVVNYFDSQRFGYVKHGAGFIMKDLLRGDFETALRSIIAKPSTLDQSPDSRVKQFWHDHWGEWWRTPPDREWFAMRPVIARLRERPLDYSNALMALPSSTRAMVVFELQSAIWNEAVRAWMTRKIPANDQLILRYQLGTLMFPRAVPPVLAETWPTRTFPLLAPDSTIPDDDVREACMGSLAREKLSLAKLRVPGLDAFFFKHEDRPLLVYPGKLHISEPNPDEENKGRLKVTLSFTLPPGAYATLVVRRVLWFATPEHAETQPVPPKPVVVHEPRKGFLERKRDEKAARSTRRGTTVKPEPRKR